MEELENKSQKFSYDQIVEFTPEGIKKRKEECYLYIDAIYCSKSPYRNKNDDVLPTLMTVGNQGGFRPTKNKKTGKYARVLLYTTKEDLYWIDDLDIESGILTYYGDNKKPGIDLHATPLHGNEILRDAFNASATHRYEDRKNVPPFFVFEKSGTCDYLFRGLAVPGNDKVNDIDWLVAVWGSMNGCRYQNYRSMFSILDIKTGSENDKNNARIDLRWLKDIDQGLAYESKYAPLVWKEWVKKGVYHNLTVEVNNSKPLPKEKQLPEGDIKQAMLKTIYEYFSPKPVKFEEFAIYLTLMMDDHIMDCYHTRPTRDGGRDGVGQYRIGTKESSTKVSFALEAKCYAFEGPEAHSVGVKETSRLISRIKQREFGVLVTTSYVANQAYEEILEDQHPIILITGKQIVDILIGVGTNNTEKLEDLLYREFPLNP